MEFENRQLSQEDIAKAREPLIKRQQKKEQQKKKVELVENKVRTAGNTIIDTLSPVQTAPNTADRIIRGISIVFLALILFQVISDFRMFSFMLKEVGHFDSGTLFYFFPYVIIPVAAIFFWMKKTIGWILLAFFIIYSTIGLIWTFLEGLSWKTNGTGLDKIFPRQSAIVYIIQMLFLMFTLYVISKANIRNIFKITKERLIAIFVLSSLATILMMHF